MRILFVGDVVGRPGRRILSAGLRRLKKELSADLAIVNGENSASGSGITASTAKEMFSAGADVITSGNHIWSKKETPDLLERDRRILRPLNFPAPTPGEGACIVETADGTPVAVVNLMGRVFMNPLDCPFQAADAWIEKLDTQTRIRIVDFHAETTSEKIAMAWHLDGRVSAVLGTHTHVATADARILPGGTAAMTDVGMTGPMDSVIGVKKERVLERFLTQRPTRFEVADGDVRINAVSIDLDAETGKAIAIERIERREEEIAGRSGKS